MKGLSADTDPLTGVTNAYFVFDRSRIVEDEPFFVQTLKHFKRNRKAAAFRELEELLLTNRNEGAATQALRLNIVKGEVALTADVEELK